MLGVAGCFYFGPASAAEKKYEEKVQGPEQMFLPGLSQTDLRRTREVREDYRKEPGDCEDSF